MDLGERLRKIRKSFDLTQQELADRIGSKRNTVATYEMGRTHPSAAIITLICREFNINENWLRYGTGEMFKEESTLSLDDYATAHHLTDIEIKILRLYMEMDEATRKDLLNMLKKALAPEEDSAYGNAPKDPQELERLFPPIDISDADSKTG